ncbi:transposase [Desulfosarcina cetonica]|uniref:IS91 family transposase n=1 Tax=Desulfosarcina cetonica TaxID=90730 RepID=UPI0006D29CF7|nr:transposase [Desulfosarcina cetonica]VTR67233.1 transposase [Desulfosarcina cetonica]
MKFQSRPNERWLDARRSELLPSGYFHLVFTLPHDLNPLIHCNPKVLLDDLSGSVNETLQTFAADPKWRLNGQLGIVGVLHTWSQTLIDHFHLHCLVPAGAWSFDRLRWNPSRKSYLFRAKSLAKQFRKTYLDCLWERYDNGELRFHGQIASLANREAFTSLVNLLRKKQWIVYAKAPFAGPEQVLDYLGRYTHRVAISNHRLLSMNDGKVTFTYKDRSGNNRTRRMTLAADEFIRRFLLHVLPPRFLKIRYFVFLFHRDKRRNIALIREQMDAQVVTTEPAVEDARQIMLRLTGIDIHCCPNCGKGQMQAMFKIPRCSPMRDPP